MDCLRFTFFWNWMDGYAHSNKSANQNKKVNELYTFPRQAIRSEKSVYDFMTVFLEAALGSTIQRYLLAIYDQK